MEDSVIALKVNKYRKQMSFESGFEDGERVNITDVRVQLEVFSRVPEFGYGTEAGRGHGEVDGGGGSEGTAGVAT